MLKWLARIILKNELTGLKETVDSYAVVNESLKDDVFKYKGFELRARVAELYIDDSEAIDELIANTRIVDGEVKPRPSYGSLGYRDAVFRQGLALQQMGAQQQFAARGNSFGLASGLIGGVAATSNFLN